MWWLLLHVVHWRIPGLEDVRRWHTQRIKTWGHSPTVEIIEENVLSSFFSPRSFCWSQLSASCKVFTPEGSKTKPGGEVPKETGALLKCGQSRRELSELQVWGRVERRWNSSWTSQICYVAEWKLLRCFLPPVALPVFQNYEEICHKIILLFLHQPVFWTTLTLPLWDSALLRSVHHIPAIRRVTCVAWDVLLAAPSVWNSVGLCYTPPMISEQKLEDARGILSARA